MSKRNPVKKGRGGLDAASIEAQLVALFDTELHSSTPGPLSCFAAADVARLEAQVEGLQAALWAQAAENVQLKAQLHTALTHGHFDHHYDDEGRWGGADDHVDDEGIIDHIAATFVPQHEIEQRVQSNAHRKRTSHVVIDLHALPGTDSVRRVSSRLDGEVSDAGDFAAEAPPLLSLSKFGFPCLDLSHEATFGAVIVMFEEGLGLLSHFQIPTKWLANYCMYLTGELTTGDADGRDAVLPYRGIPYHNWYHGFSVCQGVFSILASNTSLQDTVPKSFQLAIMLAALAHDAGHDGRNNVFHIVSSLLSVRAVRAALPAADSATALLLPILLRRTPGEPHGSLGDVQRSEPTREHAHAQLLRGDAAGGRGRQALLERPGERAGAGAGQRAAAVLCRPPPALCCAACCPLPVPVCCPCAVPCPRAI